MGGSTIYVMMATSLRGPWRYAGDVGSNHTAGHVFNPRSPYNYAPDWTARAPHRGGGVGAQIDPQPRRRYLWWTRMRARPHTHAHARNHRVCTARLSSGCCAAPCQVTKAQGNAVFFVGEQVVWVGTQWNSGLRRTPPAPRNHDLLYFSVWRSGGSKNNCQPMPSGGRSRSKLLRL